MALDKDKLENAILDRLRIVTPQILDDEILNVEVTETEKPDGSVEYDTQEVRGPVTLDPKGLEKMRPLARAIAEAVIDQIINNAETNLTSGRIS